MRCEDIHESSLYGPEFPVILLDHGLGSGLGLRSAVVPLDAQPAGNKTMTSDILIFKGEIHKKINIITTV